MADIPSLILSALFRFISCGYIMFHGPFWMKRVSQSIETAFVAFKVVKTKRAVKLNIAKLSRHYLVSYTQRYCCRSMCGVSSIHDNFRPAKCITKSERSTSIEQNNCTKSTRSASIGFCMQHDIPSLAALSKT